jgi:hypothetical protein
MVCRNIYDNVSMACVFLFWLNSRVTSVGLELPNGILLPQQVHMLIPVERIPARSRRSSDGYWVANLLIQTSKVVKVKSCNCCPPNDTY